MADVSTRLGMSQHSLFDGSRPSAFLTQVSQTDELRRLQAELKRVTERRDIQKMAVAYFAKQSR